MFSITIISLQDDTEQKNSSLLWTEEHWNTRRSGYENVV